MRPAARGLAFDLDRTLSAVVALEARVPDDAFTAASLGAERIGNGSRHRPERPGPDHRLPDHRGGGHDADPERRPARAPPTSLGSDPVTGFGLVQALEPLDLPRCRWALPAAGARRLR